MSGGLLYEAIPTWAHCTKSSLTSECVSRNDTKDLIFELWPPVITNFRLVVWELSSTKNYTRFSWGVGVPGLLSNDPESPEEPTTSKWRSSRLKVTSHIAWLLSQDMWLEEIAVLTSLRALDLELAPYNFSLFAIF